MPIYALFFLFFSVANLSFPGMSSFSGEFLTLVGSFASNTLVTFIACFGMILSAAYSLWLCNRILFGQLKVHYISNYQDVTKREVLVLLPLVICTLWMGVYPEIFLDAMHVSVSSILEII